MYVIASAPASVKAKQSSLSVFRIQMSFQKIECVMADLCVCVLPLCVYPQAPAICLPAVLNVAHVTLSCKQFHFKWVNQTSLQCYSCVLGLWLSKAVVRVSFILHSVWLTATTLCLQRRVCEHFLQLNLNLFVEAVLPLVMFLQQAESRTLSSCCTQENLVLFKGNTKKGHPTLPCNISHGDK